MAVIVQSAPAFTTPALPDAGLQTGSVHVSGCPAIVLAIGPPGSLVLAGGGGTSAVIRQSAPAIAVALGNPGTLTTAGSPIVLNRLGGRLLNTGVLGGVLV